jgi:hypothetical protein
MTNSEIQTYATLNAHSLLIEVLCLELQRRDANAILKVENEVLLRLNHPARIPLCPTGQDQWIDIKPQTVARLETLFERLKAQARGESPG